jgi:imidazolonepropionase-like amidohydrolase
MPGLIDVHCHMTYGLARTEEEISVYTPPELRTLIAAANVEKVLHAGQRRSSPVSRSASAATQAGPGDRHPGCWHLHACFVAESWRLLH